MIWAGAQSTQIIHIIEKAMHRTHPFLGFVGPPEEQSPEAGDCRYLTGSLITCLSINSTSGP